MTPKFDEKIYFLQIPNLKVKIERFSPFQKNSIESFLNIIPLKNEQFYFVFFKVDSNCLIFFSVSFC
jgi:hypothetical protein